MIGTLRDASVTLVAALAVSVFAGVSGCSAAPPDDRTGSTSEALPMCEPGDGCPTRGGVTHNGTTLDAPVCSATRSSCCVQASGGRDFDDTSAFEHQLRVWGCSQPAAFAGTADDQLYWFYSICSSSYGTATTPGPLQDLVNAHAQVAPEYSRFPTRRDADCVPAVDASHVLTLWDPRCPTSCAAVDLAARATDAIQ